MKTIAFKFRLDKGIVNVQTEYSPTLISNDGGGINDPTHGVMVVIVDEKIKIKNATSRGYIETEPGGGRVA